MRNRGIELGVGVFMLVGMLSLAMLAISVSGLTLAKQEGSYKIYARFENAGGLTARSKVTMSGVAIGKVTNISIDRQKLMALVEMEINADVDYLTSDSSASILTAGLLGEKYVGITTGAADDEILKEGDFIEDTQSSLVLEELIGKFLFNQASE
ncbi:outer membrane lipid asymmetry maintenance protein MlaD [Amphritea sp. 2_MG-2023]|jgi:phospholipid/cholesterol/gamma-HCH transport system substrate-binding protein|uniref:outer membrane lipid asymmetry maintenance protein MlaD n=1 Tax=Amphritea TaxID=515417 RepID=UPI001C064B1C|nr:MULTISPECIES: outer membrane lipid asymmetry maintenance protein MlaD [Amphritea]MBU2966115.1 outer membrane lipid asymmetry maintenance protein MlaD [Amphritea atlantica]MDO6418230.1 outer membrane lipid asymmetry maintenance protein MlaD [Amphritea sp. 2_MG-2023]